MPESIPAERKLAMLIDGDNVQLALVEKMLGAVGQFGTVIVRRAYGDWAQPNLAPWLPRMAENAIKPVQQSRNTIGKNATDSGLIIDAMDILHSGTVQGFCIVSSDGDFTALCMRIREDGLFVMGVGRRQTPNSFVMACEEFLYEEDLAADKPKAKVPASNGTVAKPAPPKPVPQKPAPQKAAPQKATTPKAVAQKSPAQPPAPKKPASPPGTKKLKALFQRAFDKLPNEDGWVHNGPLGSTLKTLDPKLDYRTYGHKTLSLLVKARTDLFEVRGKGAALCVRLKKG